MLSRTEMSFCSASTSNHFNIIKNNKSKRIVFPTLLWSLMIACFLVLVQPFCSFAECYPAFYLVLNHTTFSQIKKGHSINYSDGFYIGLLYAVPLVIS